jgi:hypothetical protein
MGSAGGAKVIGLFRGVPGCWCLSGGHAIDEFLGFTSRAHGDIDVTVAREDWPVVHAALRPVLDVWVARDGDLHSTDTTAVDADVDNLWVRQRGGGPWQLQVNLEDITGDVWSYRRNPKVTLPVSQASWWSGRLWCIAPSVQLLWKAKAPLEKDEHDYALAVPGLSAGERAWLGQAIRLAHPDSAWATRPGLAVHVAQGRVTATGSCPGTISGEGCGQPAAQP